MEPARSNLSCVDGTHNVAGSPKEETCKTGLSTTERVDVIKAFVGGVSVADCDGPLKTAMDKTKGYFKTIAKLGEATKTNENEHMATVVGFPVLDGTTLETKCSMGSEHSYPPDVVVFTASHESTDTSCVPKVVCHGKGGDDHTNRFTDKE